MEELKKRGFNFWTITLVQIYWWRSNILGRIKAFILFYLAVSFFLHLSFPRSLSHAQTLSQPHTHAHPHSPTHSHQPTCTHSSTHTHTLSLSLSQSWSISNLFWVLIALLNWSQPENELFRSHPSLNRLNKLKPFLKNLPLIKSKLKTLSVSYFCINMYYVHHA